MNPYDHARSSARQFGGRWEDYHALHSWFDASKATQCHFTHRALRHHRQGIAEAVRIFGEHVRTRDNETVSVARLGEIHVAEDCGRVPHAAAWTEGFEAPDWLPDRHPAPADLATVSAARFGGNVSDYLPLHDWFLETRHWCEDAAHLIFRHHAFGIYEAEARFGPALETSHGAIATRVVAEFHVRSVIGRTPAAPDYLRRLKGARWMLQATSPARIGLD